MTHQLAARSTPVAMKPAYSSTISIRRSMAFKPIPALSRGSCSSLSSWNRRSSPALKVCALTNVTESTFEAEVLKADLPVLVDFWATWCGPCKLVAPSMDWADKTFSGSLKVVKVDCTDANKALMEQYKVYGLPCLIVFKNGVPVEGSHTEGAVTRKDLIKYLEKHVGLIAPVA